MLLCSLSVGIGHHYMRVLLLLLILRGNLSLLQFFYHMHCVMEQHWQKLSDLLYSLICQTLHHMLTLPRQLEPIMVSCDRNLGFVAFLALCR